MDSIRILQYERWKKNNDKIIGKNSINFASLNKSVISSVKAITNDSGFVKQHIIGGKKSIETTPEFACIKRIFCHSVNGEPLKCVVEETPKSSRKGSVMVFAAE